MNGKTKGIMLEAIVHGFGTVVPDSPEMADDEFIVIFASRSSADSFADWAEKMDLWGVTRPDVWTVRLSN